MQGGNLESWEFLLCEHVRLACNLTRRRSLWNTMKLVEAKRLGGKRWRKPPVGEERYGWMTIMQDYSEVCYDFCCCLSLTPSLRFRSSPRWVFHPSTLTGILAQIPNAAGQVAPGYADATCSMWSMSSLYCSENEETAEGWMGKLSGSLFSRVYQRFIYLLCLNTTLSQPLDASRRLTKYII